MNWYLSSFFRAWVVTVGVESVILLSLMNRYFGTRVKWQFLLIASLFASSLTLPYVWFVFPFIVPHGWSLFLSELFAWLVEAIFYKMYLKLPLKDALLVSLVANGGSFSLGYFLGKVWQ